MQNARGELEEVRIALAVQVTVADPSNGKQTRVVEVAFFDECFEGPFASAQNREAGRSIPEHGRPDDVFENALRITDGFAKLLSSQFRDALVTVAMRRDLMPG